MEIKDQAAIEQQKAEYEKRQGNYHIQTQILQKDGEKPESSAYFIEVSKEPDVGNHECLQAIEKHFRKVPNAFLCGGECGCNCTPTAEKCRDFLQKQMAGSLQYQA